MQYVYEPHRLVKLEIMRASLLPHLKTIAQLRDFMLLNRERYTFPPFDPAVRGEAFRNSILPRARVAAPKFPGGSRPPRPDEPYFPGPKAIENILLETQSIGDIRFGSGERGGYYALQKAERRAEQDDSKIDSLIRDYRPLARHDPSLTVCRTSEEIALYHAVVKKWSKYDLIVTRETGYQEMPTNLDRPSRDRGRPSGAGVTASPWAGKLYCYRHGVDEGTGEFVRFRRLWRQGQSFTCGQDKKTFGGQPVCAQFPHIEDVLTRHLLRTIAHLLYNTDGMLDRLQAERDGAKRRAEQLEAELTGLKASRRKMMTVLTTMVATLDESDEATVRSMTEDFTATDIKPLVAKIAAKKREAAAEREASYHTPTSESAEEIKAELRRAVANRDAYTPDRRRELVATFVDWIGVLIPDGTGTVILEWQWSPRAILTASGEPLKDLLLAWRSRIYDNRPWTDAENDALRRLWPVPSGAGRDEILVSLLPGRNYSNIQRQVTALEIKGANRPTSFRTAWREWEHTYGEDNPDALYLHVLNWNRGAAALVRQIARDWDEKRWGPEGEWRNEVRCGLEKDRESIFKMERFSRWEANEVRRTSNADGDGSHLHENQLCPNA